MALKWQDANDIGYELFEAHEDVDPLSIDFQTLHRWITELDDFDDDRKASNEGALEAIQMAWLEEFRAE